MSGFAQLLRVSTTSAMFSVQHAVTIAAPQFPVLLWLLDVYDWVTMVHLFFLTVDPTRIVGAKEKFVFSTLTKIHIAGLCQSPVTSDFVILALPIGGFFLLGTLALCYWREVKLFIHSQRLVRSATYTQRLLGVFVVAFFPLVLINYLSPTLWVLFHPARPKDTSSDFKKIMKVISTVFSTVNLFALAGIIIFLHLFFRTKEAWSHDAIGSVSFVKNVFKSIHKTFAIAVWILNADRPLPMVPLINLGMTLLYLALDVVHWRLAPVSELLFQAILSTSLVSVALHFFLVNLWGGYSDFRIKLFGLACFQLLILNCFFLVRRRRAVVELPHVSEPFHSALFADRIKLALQIADKGSRQSRVSLLHDLSSPDCLSWFPTDKFFDKFGKFNPEIFLSSSKFDQTMSQEIFVRLEAYLRSVIEKYPEPPLTLGLLYCQLLFFHRDKQMLGLVAFIEVERRHGARAPWGFLKEQSDFRKRVEEFVNVDSEETSVVNSLHILDAIRYNEDFDLFQCQVARVIDTMDTIWNGLLVDTPEVGQLIRATKELYWQVQKAEKLFENLGSITKPTCYAHQQFICFLRNIVCDQERAEDEAEKISFLLSSKPLALKWVDLGVTQTTEDSQKQFFLISGEPATLGVITYVSNDLCSNLGLQRAFVLGRNIQELMPAFMAGFLADWMTEVLTAPAPLADQVRSRQEFIVLMTSAGHFDLILARIRVVPNFDKGLSFALYAIPVSPFSRAPGSTQSAGALIYDTNSEEIICFDKGMETAYGLAPEVLGNNPTVGPSDTKISTIFPHIKKAEVQAEFERGETVDAFLDVQGWISNWRIKSGNQLPRRKDRTSKVIKTTKELDFKKKISIKMPPIPESEDESEELKINLQLLKKLTFKKTSVAVLGITAPDIVQEIAIGREMNQSNSVTSQRRSNSRASQARNKAVNDQADNKRFQKLLEKQIRLLKAAFTPLVLVKVGFLIVFFVFLSQYFSQIQAQLTSMYLYGKRIRLLGIANHLLGHDDYSASISPPYPKDFLTSFELWETRAFTASELNSIDIPLKISASKASSFWAEPIYFRLSRENRSPDLICDPLETFPLPLNSNGLTVQVSSTDLTYQFVQALHLFSLQGDAKAFLQTAAAFLSPITTMVSRVQAMPQLFDQANLKLVRSLNILAALGLAFIVVGFVAVGVVLRQIIRRLTDVYELFAYLTDHDIQTLLDTTAHFRAVFGGTKQTIAPRIRTVQSIVFGPIKIASTSNPESARSIAHLPVSDSQESQDDRKPSHRQLPKKKVKKIQDNRAKFFSAEISAWQTQVIIHNALYFLVPAILFVFLLQATSFFQPQSQRVYQYFHQLVSFKTNITVAQSLIFNRLLQSPCEDCPEKIIGRVYPMLREVHGLITGAFSLQDYLLTQVVANITALSDNYCLAVTATHENWSERWTTFCEAHPILQNSFETVLVQLVQEMVEVARNPEFFSPVYLYLDMPIILNTVGRVIEAVEETLISELTSLQATAMVMVVWVAAGLLLLSLLGYALFRRNFIASLERKCSEKRLMVQIFQTKAVGNRRVRHWLRDNLGAARKPSVPISPS